MALSDNWQRKLDRAENRKRNPSDFVRTKKGTKVTQDTVDSIRSDEAGLQVVEDNTDIFLRELPIAIARALEEIGLVAEGYAKRLCPVDTGRLRNSITHSIDTSSMSAIIGTNVEYGPYVELGKNAANEGRGFLRPAASDHSKEYRDIVKKHLENAG